MRSTALALLVLGLAGIVMGILSMLATGINSEFNTYGTWAGMGPLYAGVAMVLIALALLRVRARL